MKFKFAVSTGYVGCERSETVEIPDEELEGLDEEARDKVINDYYDEWLWENISTHWSEISE